MSEGFYTANAAGVLVSPPDHFSANGSLPGQTSLNTDGHPFGALLIGNGSLGFVPLFPPDAADGLGNSTPPTTLTVDETLGSLFGSSASIPDGTVLEFEVDGNNPAFDSGSYTVGNAGNANGVPDTATTFSLLGLSLGGLAALRRRLA